MSVCPRDKMERLLCISIVMSSVYTTYIFWITPILPSYSQINDFYLVIFTTVLCGACAWVMPALTQILVPVIRLLSDFKINKFLTNTRITRDHLFIKKTNKASVADKIDEREFPVDWISIWFHYNLLRNPI